MENFERLEIEKQILKAVLDGSPDTKAYIFRKYSSDHFLLISELFEYIRVNLDNPSLIAKETLSQNPIFSLASRGFVASLAYTPLLDDPAVFEVIAQPLLEDYGSEQFLKSLGPLVEKVQSRTLNYKDALVQIIQKVDEINSKEIEDKKEALIFGTGGSLQHIIEQVTTPETGYYVRSGIKALDMRIGGFTRGDLIVLAAPSSHGKTLALMQFLDNMTFANPNTCISSLVVSMEIKDVTIAHRLVSCHSKIPFAKIREIKMDPAMLTEYILDPGAKQRKLQEVENNRQLVARELTQIYSNVEARGKHLVLRDYGTFSPSDLIKELAIRSYDVVVLDYINLMQGVQASDADWLRLSHLARDLKNIAKNKNLIMVTAQQLNEANLELRYSQAVKEHCDVLIKWSLPQELRDAGEGIADLNLVKGRNYGTCKIPMYFNLHQQRMYESGDVNLEMEPGLLPVENLFGNPFQS